MTFLSPLVYLGLVSGEETRLDRWVVFFSLAQEDALRCTCDVPFISALRAADSEGAGRVCVQ